MVIFSIVTVSLNAGIALIETINSILHQDFKNYEIIIKDGGSNDNSLEQLPSDDRIKLIIKMDNGIYDAMNQALEYVNGQYVLFLNAGDNFYNSNLLNLFHETIINNNHPGLVYCDYTTTGLSEYVQSPPKLTKFFLFRTMLCHQVCMIKKDLYDQIGYFNTNYKVDADYDFLLRLLITHKSNYKHIQTLGVIYTSKGFSFQNSALAKTEALQIRRKYYPNTYFYYAFLLYLTLPGLREKIVNKSNLFSRFYQRFVNAINRIF